MTNEDNGQNPEKNPGKYVRKRSAIEQAYKLISYQPRTEYQIRSILERLGYSHEEIAEASERLVEAEAIDDKKYAERYLEILIEKKHGRIRILNDFRRRGIETELATETVVQGYSREMERENAISVTRRMIAERGEVKSRRTLKSKICSKLVYLGYDYEMAGSVWDEVLSEQYSEEQEREDY